MKILIKNMVCRHCVAAVRAALEGLGLDVRSVELGRAEFVSPEGEAEGKVLDDIGKAFAPLGFGLVVDADTALVDRIKRAVLAYVREEHEDRQSLSACIESIPGISYDQASRVFSRIEGRTLERYYILQRIEYVKELLGYGEDTLSEIAFRTGYSSAAHLSRQFKEVTGVTPTEYLRSRRDRESLEKV